MTADPLRAAAVAAVAAGGAVGAVARHALQAWLPDPTAGFPWTTFSINVSGAFLLSLLPALPAVRRRELLPPLLGTGVLGGYTTLSAYSEDARHLLAAGHVATALAYLAGTLTAALLAVTLADRFSSAAARDEFDREEGDL